MISDWPTKYNLKWIIGWGVQLLTTSGENAEQDVICVGVTTSVAMDEVEASTGLDNSTSEPELFLFLLFPADS